MSYNRKFPAILIIPAAEAPPPPPRPEKGLSFFLDKECTQPLTSFAFGPIGENNRTAWFYFYVRNDSDKSFDCLVSLGVVYPMGPQIFMEGQFTPGVPVGNLNAAFEPGEVGTMALRAGMPSAQRGAAEVAIPFEVEIRADEVVLNQ